MHYNWDSVGKIMSYVIMKCPLKCKETFKTKGVLRRHLQKYHTVSEYEKFLAEGEACFARNQNKYERHDGNDTKMS